MFSSESIFSYKCLTLFKCDLHCCLMSFPALRIPKGTSPFLYRHIFTKRCATSVPANSKLFVCGDGEPARIAMDTGADVRVRVRRSVVVHVEQPVVLVLVVVTAHVQHNIRRVVVAVVVTSQKRNRSTTGTEPRLELVMCSLNLFQGGWIAPSCLRNSPPTRAQAPVKVIFGDGSRCTRPCTTQCRRPCRTTRGTGAGSSNRPRATQHPTSCSCSSRIHT